MDTIQQLSSILQLPTVPLFADVYGYPMPTDGVYHFLVKEFPVDVAAVKINDLVCVYHDSLQEFLGTGNKYTKSTVLTVIDKKDNKLFVRTKNTIYDGQFSVEKGKWVYKYPDEQIIVPHKHLFKLIPL